MASPFTTIDLGCDPAAAVAAVPPKAGVGQILGHDRQSLVIGRPANLRRWAAGNLGLGPPRPGQRPRTDLTPVAGFLAFAATSFPFQQRLLFERLMERSVPRAKRRDLRPAAFLHLDTEVRFPRVTVRSELGDRRDLYGPWRDRRAAEAAAKALHRLFPLRPCDAPFEPRPDLPLGIACLYAQVRSCAAPCLARIDEEGYRALARRAVALLDSPSSRGEEIRGWLPPWIVALRAPGLVVEQSRQTFRLYPVRDGAVLDQAIIEASAEQLRDTLDRLTWPDPPPGRDDTPWLSSWLHAPRRRGSFLVRPNESSPDHLAGLIQRLCLGAASLQGVIT